MTKFDRMHDVWMDSKGGRFISMVVIFESLIPQILGVLESCLLVWCIVGVKKWYKATNVLLPFILPKFASYLIPGDFDAD